MGILDDIKNIRLAVCADFINREFSEHANLNPSPDQAYLTLKLVTPEDGGSVMRFIAEDKEWMATDSGWVQIDIHHEGKMVVTYAQSDSEDSGMYFMFGHPREAAELLHLFVHPKAFLTQAADDNEFETVTLGELFNCYAVIPDGKGWRILDPEVAIKDMPENLEQIVFPGLVRDWDQFASGMAVPSAKLRDEFPKFVASMPDARRQLSDGYILGLHGGMISAVDHLVMPPPEGVLHIEVLCVPARPHTSALFLRELINRDADTSKRIRNIFASAPNMTALFTELKSVKIKMPSSYQHQVRMAAESLAISQWLINIGKCLANQPGTYYAQVEQQWHLAHALSRLLAQEHQ